MRGEVMEVRVRALIWNDEMIVVRRETRIGQVCTALPGGRVRGGETVEEALVREVAEETGIEIRPGRLAYVAEVVSPHHAEHLELIFESEAVGPVHPPGVDLLTLLEASRAPLLPPVIGAIQRDIELGTVSYAPRWLGNIWDPEIAHVNAAA
jgi:ADP-ribose pyrophosphatase YjhB (NUDIX family)